MEYVGGLDLATLLDWCAALDVELPPPLSLHIACEMLAGLHAAHEHVTMKGNTGVVHRDVSPTNVLISWEGDVKVCDFGIAHAVGVVRQTPFGVRKGKLAYMSPEQAGDLPLDRQSDVFSAGLVLYEMLTGQRAYEPLAYFELLEQVLFARMPRPRHVHPEISVELEARVLGALEKDRRRRYDSAASFRLALLELLAGRSHGDLRAELSTFLSHLYAAAKRHPLLEGETPYAGDETLDESSRAPTWIDRVATREAATTSMEASLAP
jgi:serine/threonine protein kinase